MGGDAVEFAGGGVGVEVDGDEELLVGDEFLMDKLGLWVVAGVAVVAGAAIARKMSPGEEDVFDFFGPEGGEALSAGAVFEQPRELAVVEAGVVDGADFEVEGLGVADEEDLFAGLPMLVEPAVSGFDADADFAEVAVVAAEAVEGGEIAVVGVEGDERKMHREG